MYVCQKRGKAKSLELNDSNFRIISLEFPSALIELSCIHPFRGNEVEIWTLFRRMSSLPTLVDVQSHTTAFDSLSPSQIERRYRDGKIPLLISLLPQGGVHFIGFLSKAIDHILFTASFLVHNFCCEYEMKCWFSTWGKVCLPTIRLKRKCFDRFFNIWRVMMWLEADDICSFPPSQ